MARTGAKALSLRNQGPQTALWRLDDLSVIPGVVYRVQVWLKTQETKGESGISLRFRDEKDWVSAPVMQPDALSGTHDWTLMTFELTAPPSAKSLCIFLANTNGAGGQAWFDDLSIEDNLDQALMVKLPEIIRKTRAAAAAKSVPERLRKLSQPEMEKLSQDAEHLLKEVAQIGSAKTVPFSIQSIAAQWLTIIGQFRQVEREAELLALLSQWRKMRRGEPSAYLLGWQDSVTRVWLRDRPANFRLDPEPLLAVKGEVVAAQLVVGAISEDLRGVQVSASDLVCRRGAIPADRVSIHPIGFANVRRPDSSFQHSTESLEPGWWPEILLDNFRFDVAAGDTQPVWISVQIPRDAKPGRYRGTIEVSPDNASRLTADFEIEIANVELPAKWHFRNIMSFHDGWCREFYGEQWRPELRARFLDFLFDRRINLTSMYEGRDFSFDEISRAVERGQNVILPYTISPTAGLTEPPWMNPKEEKAARDFLDEWVSKLKTRGWLDRSYLYGFDERSREMFPAIRHSFERFKRDYGLQTITTAYDYSFGLETELGGAVDNFVPLIPRYNESQADKARARGAKVWWYEVVWNIEQRLLRSRLLPWQTFKVKSDGFLIWCINRWRGEGAPKLKKKDWKTNTQPVRNVILNEWDPWLDGVTPNSSANYLYPGENGPLSSTRLECFRDGIEDYDLLMAAVERLEELKRLGGSRKAIAKLQEAITIDDAFIKDGIQSSYSVEQLNKHRERLIRALERTAEQQGENP